LPGFLLERECGLGLFCKQKYKTHARAWAFMEVLFANTFALAFGTLANATLALTNPSSAFANL